MTRESRRILAVRLGALFIACGTFFAPPELYLIAAQFQTRYAPEGWPGGLSSPAYQVMLWLVVITSCGLVLLRSHSPLIRNLWAGTLLVCVGLASLCFPILGKAETFGGLWVGAWWCWFAVSWSRDPAHVHRFAGGLAMFIIMALFLPPAIGKLTAEWQTGSVLIYLHRPETFQPFVQHLTDLDERTLAKAYGSIAAIAEAFLGTAILWPRRLIYVLVLASVVFMITTWNPSLIAILLPVAGMVVGAWLVDQPEVPSRYEA